MKKQTRPLKKVPTFKTDEEAEEFVAHADLSKYDLTGTPVMFEFEPKSGRINMRLPPSLVETLKERAKKRGMPYQRFTREMIELGLSVNSKRKAG